MTDRMAGEDSATAATAPTNPFEARLRQIGAERYHDRHPFHQHLHRGKASVDQVRAWVVNRWYYQSRIPMKDAAFMSRVENPVLRRIWRSRIEDHDGTDGRDGGIRRWLRLAEAEGLDPDYVASGVGVMPELFAPKIHAERITGLLEHYDFATVGTIAHFRHRLSEAHKDVAFGPQWVLDHTVTTADQDAAAAALTFKTEVLWAQLDALWHGYVAPGRIPPGARARGEGLR